MPREGYKSAYLTPDGEAAWQRLSRKIRQVLGRDPQQRDVIESALFRAEYADAPDQMVIRLLAENLWLKEKAESQIHIPPAEEHWDDLAPIYKEKFLRRARVLLGHEKKDPFASVQQVLLPQHGRESITLVE